MLLPAVVLADEEVNAIAQNLMCQCGCTMMVPDCVCGTADQFRQTIRQQLDEGKSKDQILAYFVSQYGEKVLGAPTKQGFNLTAWVIPFAAIIGGGGGIYMVLRTWVLPSRRRVADEPVAAIAAEEKTEYEEQLKRDLENFGED